MAPHNVASLSPIATPMLGSAMQGNHQLVWTISIEWISNGWMSLAQGHLDTWLGGARVRTGNPRVARQPAPPPEPLLILSLSEANVLF